MIDKSTDSKEGEKLFMLKHQKRSFLGIIVSTFFLRVAFGSTTVLMPLYIYKHLRMEGWIANIAIMIVEVTYALAVIASSGYFGSKADLDDAKKWILFGTASGGLVLFGYGVCAFNWQGLIGIVPLANGLIIFGMSVYHFIHGIAGSAKVNASYGYISRFSVYENRATRMGIYNVAVTAGRSTGVVLAGFLYKFFVGQSDDVAWQPLRPSWLVYEYLVFAFFLIISALVVYFSVEKTRPVISKSSFSLKKQLLASWNLLTNKDRRGIILPLVGTASIIGILNNWAFLVISLETGADVGSTVTVLLTLLMGAPMALWGYVADKIGRKKTLAIGVFGMIGMTFMLGFSYFGNYVDPDDLSSILDHSWIITLLVIFVILASAYFPAISGRLGDSSSIGFKEERHGTTMSVQQTIMSLSEIIGIVLGGVALIVVYSFVGDIYFYYNMIGLMIPIVFLLILTTIATLLWPAEEEFISKANVRRKE
ncbi:MAG: MFS transporter [Candidatus Heimdallarchaeum aukensis]|uniref:MFS transporter n=1 Tax=Candidatus Heimdallarchaeum aukensis TaxID=2876573 RepID=A0A9Y1FMY6_9ARCH|nr:MAG: MFS transporter [Candidatus Heimdallarchaeum aukensis]